MKLKREKNKKIGLLVAVIVLVLAMGACSAPRDVVYFQGIDTLTEGQIERMSQDYVSGIVPDDLLAITVTAWDPTVVTPFNLPAYAFGGQGETAAVTSGQLATYLVDAEGAINFPVLGKIQVGGLSKRELSVKMQEMIARYVKDALVNVQIVNYKVTVMGEIARPGTIAVKNDRVSILDALGQAGDLTINANRKNILVIRDTNGVKEFGRLDITGPDFFASPYFYLRQNDVVYVEPNDAKKRNARYSQAQQYNITVFSSILSAVSVITTVILAITK